MPKKLDIKLFWHNQAILAHNKPNKLSQVILNILIYCIHAIRTGLVNCIYI